jgi:hypothetical protein
MQAMLRKSETPGQSSSLVRSCSRNTSYIPQVPSYLCVRETPEVVYSYERTPHVQTCCSSTLDKPRLETLSPSPSRLAHVGVSSSCLSLASSVLTPRPKGCSPRYAHDDRRVLGSLGKWYANIRLTSGRPITALSSFVRLAPIQDATKGTLKKDEPGGFWGTLCMFEAPIVELVCF